MKKRTVDMTVGSPAGHILTFALPLLLTNLGQQLYMIADAVIVGRGVGVRALAAVGATDWVCWMILWTVTGLTQGFSAFVAQCFGEGNYRQMNKTIAASGILCGGISGILTLSGLLAAKPLMVWLNTPQDIIPGALTYLRTMISGTVIVGAYNMAASILRGMGDGKSPLVAMVIAAVLNIGLDCLFVFVFRLGIFGAALASVMAQCVSFLYCLKCILKVDCVCLEREVWKPDWKLMKQLIGFGIPLTLRFLVVSLGGLVLQSSINSQGSIFVAGYTATNKVYGLLECSAISVGLASCTFLAQNYGAFRYDRVKQGVRTAVVIVGIASVVISMATLLVREPLLRLFLDVKQAGAVDAIRVGMRYLTILTFCLFILYLIHVFTNALQAMGIAVWSMWSGIAELAGRIFMAKIAIRWIGRDALFISEPVAWLGATLLLVLPYLYYSRKLLRQKNE